jgi:hypothetical protein
LATGKYENADTTVIGQFMNAKRLTPILNVSDLIESFAWFEKLGWQKVWDWGEPPTYGAVVSGPF